MKSSIDIKCAVLTDAGSIVQASISTALKSDPFYDGQWFSALTQIHCAAAKTGLLAALSECNSRHLLPRDPSDLFDTYDMSSVCDWRALINHIPMELVLEWILSAGNSYLEMLDNIPVSDSGVVKSVECEGEPVVLPDNVKQIYATIIACRRNRTNVVVDNVSYTIENPLRWDMLPIHNVKLLYPDALRDDDLALFIGLLMQNSAFDSGAADKEAYREAMRANEWLKALAALFGTNPDVNAQTLSDPHCITRGWGSSFRYTTITDDGTSCYLSDEWRDNYNEWVANLERKYRFFEPFSPTFAGGGQSTLFRTVIGESLYARKGIPAGSVLPAYYMPLSLVQYSEPRAGVIDKNVMGLLDVPAFLYSVYLESVVEPSTALSYEQVRIQTNVESGVGNDQDNDLLIKPKPLPPSKKKGRNYLPFVVAGAAGAAALLSGSEESEENQPGDPPNRE